MANVKRLICALGGALIAVLAAGDAVSARLGGQTALFSGPVLTLDQKAQERLFARTMDAGQLVRLSGAARQTLAAEPLSSEALWVWSASRKDKPKAAEGFVLAERVTRRSLPVQMELLRTRSEQGDLVAGFGHLDRAMSVFPDAGNAMLPGLVALVEDPQGRALLVKNRSRPWFATFVGQVAARAEGVDGLLALMEDPALTSQALPPAVLSGILQRLVHDGEGPRASRLAVRYTGMKPSDLSHFGISKASLRPEALPFAWQLFSNEAVSAAARDGGNMEFTLEAGRAGPMMERVTAYPAGRYLLSQTLSGTDARMDLGWDLHCLDKAGNRLLLSLPVPVDQRTVQSRAEITIPAGCSAQRWTFKGDASDLAVLGSIVMEQLSLKPM